MTGAAWDEEWSDYRRWQGNCYEVAFKYLMAHEEAGLVLCHGEPVGRGPQNMGMRYGHAWVESEDGSVIDCTVPRGDQGIPWMLFYTLGNLTPAAVRRYSREEAMVRALRVEHYGPWPDDEPLKRKRRGRGKAK